MEIREDRLKILSQEIYFRIKALDEITYGVSLEREREGAAREYSGKQKSMKTNKKALWKEVMDQIRWGLRSDHWVEQDPVISDNEKNWETKLYYSELRGHEERTERVSKSNLCKEFSQKRDSYWVGESPEEAVHTEIVGTGAGDRIWTIVFPQTNWPVLCK